MIKKSNLPKISHVLSILTLVSLAQCTTPEVIEATATAPYINSLGMKFVPIPGTSVLMCTTEVTIDQFQAMGLERTVPVYPQSGNHPVVNVSYSDAETWCSLASRKDKVSYRLPTKEEWILAAGSSIYPWGLSWPPTSGSCNALGQEAKNEEIKGLMLSTGATSTTVIGGFIDQHSFTSPVGTYSPNARGLYDMAGNVFELLEDTDSQELGLQLRIGGSWASSTHDQFQMSKEHGLEADDRDIYTGFRVVIDQ